MRDIFPRLIQVHSSLLGEITVCASGGNAGQCIRVVEVLSRLN
ncbi:Protein of unknown function [Pyronema omphalodes CBS 100304]|uniref:Uncharacterized protein n=1 Tax=Pyronema omphalodes (strain CBS 100304) TaxID=1076935 RepID=U4LCI1_PYROM|nr:Protein of unknown function [Pyronema omphalodes CBS 100304]